MPKLDREDALDLMEALESVRDHTGDYLAALDFAIDLVASILPDTLPEEEN